MKGKTNSLFRPTLLRAAFGLLAAAGAVSSQAAFGVLHLTNANQVVPQQTGLIWFSATLDITQDNNSLTLYVNHLYHDGNYADVLPVDSYAQSFYDWLATGQSAHAGAHYSGPLFALQQDATDPIGQYNHMGAGLTAPALAYVGFNGLGGGDLDYRSNMESFNVTITPEPATMAVLGLGALPLLRRRRK